MAGGTGVKGSMKSEEQLRSASDKVLVTLGYSGWGAGQLESEIAQNAWLTVHAAPQIIFDVPASDKYDAALRLLGVDSSQLTGHAGHA